MKEYSELQQYFFLIFGHFIDQTGHTPYKFVTPSALEKKSSPNFRDTQKIWEKTIHDLIDHPTHQGRIVVPLSGGLDSRLILAGLLKYLDAREIITYTFGSEESLDFKIGNLVAKKAGTKHFAKPISLIDYNYETEKKWASITKEPTTLFYHPPIEVYEEFINDNLWFGFMGDPLAGSHFYPNLTSSKEVVQHYFSKYSSISRFDAKNYGFEIEKIDEKIEKYLEKNQNLNSFEFLDFHIRQNQYIAPHVIFSKLSTLPFIQENWSRLMLSLPSESRISEKYYRKFMVSAYPDLFKLPCKNNFGYSIDSKFSIMQKIQMKINPEKKKMMINYLDFDQNLKNNSHFAGFIKEIFFNGREIGKFSPKELENVWKDFQKGHLSYSFILNIASLAIITD